VIPVIEELQTAWESRLNNPRFSLYYPALSDSLNKLRKYYIKFDNKPVIVLALCTWIFYFIKLTLIVLCLVVHPYYGLDYIELEWGGEKEQDKARAEGNANAKNYVAEARKIVEAAVHVEHVCNSI
jgi:hypothetical protein